MTNQSAKKQIPIWRKSLLTGVPMLTPYGLKWSAKQFEKAFKKKLAK